MRKLELKIPDDCTTIAPAGGPFSNFAASPLEGRWTTWYTIPPVDERAPRDRLATVPA